MLSIPCPHCGPREETEFTYGGPSHITRPAPTANDREWTHYLYHRDNTKGPHRERWLHSFGCGIWFNVLRDTVTHEISEVYPMGRAPHAPERGR
jgi:sarcosine oxidase subunit delta